MNRTLKEATMRRYHYDSHDQLRQHLGAFLDAYNFARRLKTLKGLTPFECICKAWTKEPDRFKYDPTHLTSGLHTWSARIWTHARGQASRSPYGTSSATCGRSREGSS